MSPPPKTAPPTPVTAYSVACGMGRTTAGVLEALEQGRSGLAPCPLDVPFDTLCGALPGELEPPPAAVAEHDSHVVRVAMAGYAEIADDVAAAVARWGADRVAVLIGTSTGGIGETEAAYLHWREHGALPTGYDYERQHPFHLLADVVARVAGAQGPRAVISTACSSGARVVASARRLLRAGVVDAALVGGVDGLCHTTVRGFNSLGVMAAGACRPFGADRPGMNVGEASAYLLLEREGRPLGWILGAGESSDAWNMSSPHPEGAGARAAMQAALAEAGLTPADVDYVNAHGTGTQRNDLAEALAVSALLGDDVPVVSTKSYTGHTLGACGTVEAVFALASLERGFVPAALGSHPLDPDVTIHVPAARLDRELKVALSSSFAFGGNNCVLALGRAS